MLDVADRGGAEYQPKPRLVGVERRDDRSGGLGRIAWRQPVVVANVTPRWADDLFVLGHLGRLVGGVRAKKRPMRKAPSSTISVLMPKPATSSQSVSVSPSSANLVAQ